MDNRKKKKFKEQPKKHMSFDVLDVPQVNEPMPVCSLCGKSIETIADSFCEPDGSYSHFDCVLDKIRKQERVSEDETVSYIGHGNFAVFYKNEEGKFIPVLEGTECSVGHSKQKSIDNREQSYPMQDQTYPR